MAVPFDLLKNHIDITKVPFSDRGSRLLVYKSTKVNSFYIKLAERLFFLDSQIESYLKRPPFVDRFCLLDASGNELDFEITSYPHMLKLKTVIGEFSIVFQDERTLSIGIPNDQNAGIRFQLSAKSWKTNNKGGRFEAVRNLSYQSNAEPVLNTINPDKDTCVVDFLVRCDQDCAITLSIDEKELTEQVRPFSHSASDAKTRWRNWFENAPPVEEKYQKTYLYAWWVMANNLISPHGKVLYEAMMPSKTKYFGLWLWDSALHALAFRHVDPLLAQNQIRAMLAHQLPNGMLPDAIYDEGIIAEIDHPFKAEVTKPPILAWAALKLHELNPDKDFLGEIYDPLVRWNSWWFGENDFNLSGLAQYKHPYSSGLDDSPLWDYGMPVESPDINTYLCIQMDALARMADILGNQAEAEKWRKYSLETLDKIYRELWHEESGFFNAYTNENVIPVLTPFNLYPLWTGRLRKSIQKKLLAHLTNQEEFWGNYPLPTVARNDTHFEADIMWRGPVWANINYFFIEALQRVGENGLARELRRKTLDMISAHQGIFEYYNAETGLPGRNAAPIFGWTAAVFIDLAIQAYHEKE